MILLYSTNKALELGSTMKKIAIALFALSLSACSVVDPLVYKIDIPQGNYIEQKDVDQLRVGMTREQVAYVLGKPVVENAFRADTWHYIYRLKPGRGEVFTREAVIHFENEKVVRLS